MLTEPRPIETQHFDVGRTATAEQALQRITCCASEKWSDFSVGYDASLTCSDAQACRSEVALEASRPRMERSAYSDVLLSSPAGTAGTFSTLASVKLIRGGSCRGEAGPEDVGDQTLMRGLDTALPFVRPGLSLSGVGRRSCDRPRSKLGSSPCRGRALATARLCLAGTQGLWAG